MKTSISIVLSVFVLLICSMFACSLQAQNDAGYLLSAAKHGIVDAETGEVSFLQTKDFKVKRYKGAAGDSISFRMVYIAGDTFTMGKSGPQDEVYGPVENIVVGNYWMCNTEVTQGLWESVMDTVWAEVVYYDFDYGVGSNFPVYYVSWYDAVIFCNRLSVLCGMTPVYGDSGMDDIHKQAITAMGYSAPKMDYSASITNVEIDYTANGFRLPTEVEWEYAARGGAGVGTHYAGTDIDNVSSDINVGGLGAYAWYSGNSQGKTHEAGTKLPNILGLFDMSGNVWEWCNDWYQSGSAGVGDNPVDGVGPTGASTGSNRVLRGGNWIDAAVNSRVAYRRGNAAPSNRYSNLGFRLAVSSAL